MPHLPDVARPLWSAPDGVRPAFTGDVAADGLGGAMSRERALDVAKRLGDCDPLRVDDANGMVGPGHLWNRPPTAEDVLEELAEEYAFILSQFGIAN